MNARRILLLVTDLEIGGTPTVVRELAMRLHEPSGAEIEVACLGPWGAVADQLRSAAICVTALEARGARDVAVVRRLIRLIRARGYDTVFSLLVHANAAAAAASLVCRDLRYIQSIQTTQPRPRWHWWVQAVAQHAAERIVVPSPSVAQAAIEWSAIPPERITVIPNAIDPAEFACSSVSNRDPRPYPIGFIGRLDPVKRIPLLLAALARLNGLVHLHIFGDGRERDAIRADIARLGLERHVTLHGAIDRPQPALAQIGLLVLPSQAEGFGLVLIEAMAASVPVIAMNVPGVRDVVHPNEDGLLLDGDAPSMLADEIRRVVGDRALRARLISGGIQTARQRFSWSRVMPMYRHVLGMAEP